MAEETFYPDAHPESTSVDGDCEDFTNNQTWSQKVALGGSTSDDEGDYLRMIMTADDISDKWRVLKRLIILFDISGLPEGATITGLTLTLYGGLKVDDLSCTPDLNVYSSAPASNVAVAPGDYDSLGTTPYCDTPITYAGFNIGTPGDPNNFVLNAAGLAAAIAAFAGDGILKLGLRNANYDVADALDPGNHDPNWVLEANSYLILWSADKGTTYRPKLVITYTPVVAKARSHGYIIG